MPRHYIFYLIVTVLLPGILFAQTNDTNGVKMLEPSLMDIINLKPSSNRQSTVSISNLLETNTNEVPNIITIITEDDINALGSRDLIDILNTVPGINIAIDVQNGTSIGMRGIWTSEGRILFMINGLELNDMAYGSIILGQRFQIDNIKRIEIIRGAGSSMYGGFAGLGVINIITKTGQEINGHKLMVAGGYSEKATSRKTISYNYGGALLKGIELTGSAIVNVGNRSNACTSLNNGTVVNFRDSSLVNTINVGFGLVYKNLSLKQFYEDYNFQATYEPIFSLVRTNLSEVAYTFKTKKFSIIPFINFKWQLPWNTQYGDPNIYDAQNLATQRKAIGFKSFYNIGKIVNLTFGGQLYTDRYNNFRKSRLLSTGNYQETLLGNSLYSEVVLKTKYVNFNLGGRFEKYADFNPVVLPRLSATRAFKKWHYKILYSQSYKIPPLQNINLDVAGNITPERITEYQFELGMSLKQLDIIGTIFNTNIKKYIVYGYNEDFIESYINSGNITNNGIELALKYKLKKLKVNVNYSYYNVFSSSVNEIIVDSSNYKLGTLAMPKNKFVLGASYKIIKNNFVSINYIYQSSKYNYEVVDLVLDENELVKYPETHNINISYQRTGMLNNLLDLNVGIYNVLNTQNRYLYTTIDGAPPVFGMGRELFINLKFNL